jgi:Kef-type K+ transport system membrane component KefB
VDLLGVPVILGTWGSVSPNPLHSILKVLAEIGLIQLMFLAGLQADWSGVKADLSRILSLGFWSSVLTLLSVTLATRYFSDRWAEALGLGAMMAASGFGISALNLSRMKILESHAASVISGATALSGLLALLFMIATLATNYAMMFGGFKAAVAVSWFLGKLIMFYAIAYFLLSRFLNRVTGAHLRKRQGHMLIGYFLLVAASYAWAAMHFGSFAAVGAASLGGIVLGRSNFEGKERISEVSESTLTSIPIGILFIVLGMEVNFREAGVNIIFLIILLGTVIASKMMGGWTGTRKGFESPRERALSMFGTLYQGEMGMLIAAYLFSRGVVNPSQFNMAIIVMVILTMLSPILMKVVSIEITHGNRLSSPFKKGGVREIS